MWNEANSVNSHCGPLHELERMVLTPLQSLADVELQYSSRVDHSAKRMFFCQNPGWVVAHPVTHLPPPLVATDRSGGRYQHALEPATPHHPARRPLFVCSDRRQQDADGATPAVGRHGHGGKTTTRTQYKHL
jgi:hypothetical protein